MAGGSRSPQHMQVSPDAEPLRPEELKLLRRLLRGAKRELDDYLDAEQVAEKLGLTKRTVLDMVSAGEFPQAIKPMAKVVRIPVGDVLAFVDRNRVQARALEGAA